MFQYLHDLTDVMEIIGMALFDMSDGMAVDLALVPVHRKRQRSLDAIDGLGGEGEEDLPVVLFVVNGSPNKTAEIIS
jgi:hypothetical protein